jgi:two-component system, OmpR family, lantibiotic biosynthesis response regulator NisR/SpaR
MVLIVTSGRAAFLLDVLHDLKGDGVPTLVTEGSPDPAATPGSIDLVILDPYEDEGDGISRVGAIRNRYSVPILVISRRRSVEQRVSLLDEGADQILEVPYHRQELLACVHAVQRRRRFLMD